MSSDEERGFYLVILFALVMGITIVLLLRYAL